MKLSCTNSTCKSLGTTKDHKHEPEYFATRGTVEIDNQRYVFPLRGVVEPKPWPSTTVVFQSLHLFPHWTLRANIYEPVKDVLDESRRSDIARFIATLGLDGIMNRHPNETSLGQRQRAAIVRALALRPRYLLLDEVTSALDVEHVAIVAQLLGEVRSSGVGVLVATHQLDFARSIADQFLFLEQGGLVAQGDVAALVSPTNPRLRKFVEFAAFGPRSSI